MQSRLGFSIFSKAFIVMLFTTSSLFAQNSILDTAAANSTTPVLYTFYVPNAFTPDGDGVNDTFTGKGEGFSSFEMKVLDRWEHLIFTSNDINTPWDGRANGGNKIAQNGIYVYIFKVTDNQNQNHTYQGMVTLFQ